MITDHSYVSSTKSKLTKVMYRPPLGKPVLDSLGPVGEFPHTDHEYILMESLFERTKVNALFLKEYCELD